MSDDKKALEDALERYADHMRISACADNEGQHNAHMDAAHGEYLTILHMFDALRAAQQAKVPDDVLPSAVELLTRVERHPENMLGDTLLRSNVRTFLEKIAAQSAQEGKV